MAYLVVGDTEAVAAAHMAPAETVIRMAYMAVAVVLVEVMKDILSPTAAQAAQASA